ncbi:MAG: hypothetical protein ACYDEN_05320, partial [Acidimicrobiales bacterium]
MIGPILLAAGGGFVASAAIGTLRSRRPDGRFELISRLSEDLLATGDQGDQRAELELVLGELRRVLRARRAEITLVDGDGWRRTALDGVQGGPGEQHGQGSGEQHGQGSGEQHGQGSGEQHGQGQAPRWWEAPP